ASAPYFSHFWAEIEPLFGQRHDFLFDLNLSYAQQMARLLKISAPFSLTDDFMGITPSEGFQVEPYYQVFSPVIPFVGGLSVLDFLFCENSWRARSE
ncbi:MAG: WbqC family protein, partial [Mucinivorans sp.]